MPSSTVLETRRSSLRARTGSSPWQALPLGALLFLLSLALGACGKEEQSATCVAGQTTSCACPRGLLGVQECTDDGRYGACICENEGADVGFADTGLDANTGDLPPGDRNLCNGRQPLLLEGIPSQPGDVCGPCDDGIIICDSPDTLRCLGAKALNACGGCGVLDDEPGASCGTCGTGTLVCNNAGSLDCADATEANACGGCSSLDGEPLFICSDAVGMQGIWHCASREEVFCVTPGKNACGGDQPLSAIPWTSCGRCSQGVYQCEDPNSVACTEQRLNACGGCEILPGRPGQSCGPCGAIWECDGEELVCNTRLNPCGGCAVLTHLPGTSCGNGNHYVCDGTEAVQCVYDAVNPCGGDEALPASPGSACGPCGDGQYICTGINRISCFGAGEPNACGGCERLANKVDSPCGVCFEGTWQCAASNFNALICDGSEGAIDFETDDDHCGWCKNRCATAHPDARCVAGQCLVETAFAVMVTAGRQHACALPGDGTVHCWGDNSQGAVTGQAAYLRFHRPVQVGVLDDIVQISAGDYHTCARTQQGRVICWGQSMNARLGPGTTGTNAALVPIDGLDNVIDIAAGSQHSCAVEQGGRIRCWGVNTNARLGTGDTTAVDGLATVIDIDDAVAVTVGADHSCARRADGTARCWGANNLGQIGNGQSTPTQTSPVSPINLGTIRDIAAGTGFTCAVLTSNTVSCWGTNDWRQLGRGDLSNSLIPVAVTGINTAEAIAAGSTHACARRNDGALRCWGSGTQGELGHGEFLIRDYMGQGGASATPVAPEGLTGVAAIGLGYQFSCAATTLGKMHCWGANAQGQLGDNQLQGTPPVSRRRPFPIPTLGPITTEAGLCADNVDNDGDGDVDCADSDCATSLGSAVGPSLATGTTCDAGNYFVGSCHVTDGGTDPYETNAAEVVYTWIAPETGTYRFSTADSTIGTVLYLRDDNCTGEELRCARSEWNSRAELVEDVTAGSRLVIIVDSIGSNAYAGEGYGQPCGDYILHITREL